MKYFSYDPCVGMERHATLEEAKACAQLAIDLYRDEASEGWPEWVEEVCFGEIIQEAKEIDTTKETGQDFETCDYQLVDFT